MSVTAPPFCLHKLEGSTDAVPLPAAAPTCTMDHGLYDEDVLYKSFQLFLNRSSERQVTRDLLQNTVSNIQLNKEKSQIDIIGVGSATGDNDLEIISQLRLKHPGVPMEVEVVEPSGREIHIFRETVAQASHLDHVNFIWNQMTSDEFEEQWRQRNITKKVDLIHMLHMLYYLKDPGPTIRFYQSLLEKNGKLLITAEFNDSLLPQLANMVSGQLSQWPSNFDRSAADIKSLLDESGFHYQSYRLQFWTDVTECFTEGDENGELLLSFFTMVENFSKKASPELRQAVLKFLRDPKHSVEKDGKILAKSTIEALLLGASD